MNLNDKMCEVGAINLAAFLCMDLGEGGGGTGDIIIADGIFIEEEPLVALMEFDEVVLIADEPDISVPIEEDDIIIEIIEDTEDEVDVI